MPKPKVPVCSMVPVYYMTFDLVIIKVAPHECVIRTGQP